jgi:hypothetical protein
MRARALAAAGLVTTLLSACSDAPDNPALGTDPAFAEELELAIFSSNLGASGESAVLSDVELARPESPGDAPRLTPSTQHQHPVAAPESPVELLGVPVATLAMAEEPAASAALPTREIVGAVEVPAAGRADRGADNGDGDVWTGGRSGPTIIIRGGVSGRDPCALHLPGRGGSGALGAIGVLINDRAPRIGVGDPGMSGRGMPRRGSILPGGIR